MQPVVDMSDCLAPIEGNNPAGKDLRSDTAANSLYRRIRDARSQARDEEKLVLQGEAGRPDWRPVMELAREALLKHSKDLQVACWLTEGAVRTDGFAGFAGAIQLLHGLTEKYWDSFYPLPDEDGISGRMSAVAGLNGEDGEGVLVYPLSNIPIITANGSAYGLAAFQQARSLAQIADEEVRQARISRGAITVEALQTAVREMPAESITALRTSINQCLANWDQLSAALGEKCGSDAPPTSKIREILVSAGEMLARFVPEDSVQPAAEAVVTENPHGSPGSAPAGQPFGAAPMSREQAFVALERVSAFFKKTEPHSPVSYALEQAVRWGRMPLPQLLNELIVEESTLKSVYRLIGISSGEPKEE